MPRSRRIGAAFVLGLVALGLAACGEGKSYSFPEVRIDATVNQDGSLSIVEERTFDFRGSFSFAFFTVEHKQFDDVVDFSVSEGDDVYEEGAPEVPGHVRLEDAVLEGPGGFKFKATWWFRATDERRTWTFRYRVACAVDLYTDTAHLLWKLVGEGWTVPTDHAVITVRLPPAADPVLERPATSCSPSSDPPPAPDGRSLRRGEVRAWGHGPLQGEVRLPDPQTVVLDVRDVPPSAFVEASVLFPAEAVPGLYQGATPGFERILAEEAALAEEANRIRREARALERSKARWRTAGWAYVAAWPLLGMLAVAWMRVRDRTPGVPRVLPDPPEPGIRPAVLALERSVWKRRVGHADAFRAQLLTLAQDGAIEIRPLGRVSDAKDYELIPRHTPEDELDRRFFKGMFLSGAPVATKGYHPVTKELALLGNWWDSIIKAAKATGNSVRKSFLPFVAMPFLVAFWAVPLAVFSEIGGWWVALAIAMTIATPLVMRRLVPLRYRPERMERMQRWEAFRRYLKDFSSLPEAPTAAIVIWERYLALATALGVADTVERQVRMLVPEPSLPRSPWGASAGAAVPPPAINSMLGSVSTRSVVHSASYQLSHASSSSGASSSSFSSSSGFSGGGFSSGGGGGGGGTGGGAG